jgi:alanine racemase
MGGYYGGAHADVLAHGLMPVVYDLGQVEAFARLVRGGLAAGPVDVHLKVDTGMARLGVTMGELGAFAAKLRGVSEVRVRGLMTHLASADSPSDEETEDQIARFEEARALLARAGVAPEVRHAANSAALFRQQAAYDAVRPGVALFGISPFGDEDAALRHVMRVRTEVIDVRDVAEGAKVGYGGLWRAPRRSRVATVPMGYADGLSRQLTNRGHLLLRGKRAPIVGAVSMDMTMVDVTDLPGVAVRDEAVVLGAQEGPLGKDFIGAAEVAEHAGTIAWEILTSISRRVPRFYRQP